MTLSSMLWAHLALDLVCACVLVLAIYHRYRPGGDAPFTLFMLNMVTFCLTTLLANVSIDLGVSLGLFAIFGILRYRTSALDIGDLTYVFIVIGIAVINGISIGAVSLIEVAGLNVLILGAAAVLEEVHSRSGLATLKLRYDRIDLLVPVRRDELLADLSERLGLRCTGVNVVKVNLLMSTADLIVEFESQVKLRGMFSASGRSSFSGQGPDDATST